ncbi:MAG: PP2C family serine/threonine-protein phosphatase [Pirellulales bacterium]
MDPRQAETVELIKPALAAEKYFSKSAVHLAFEFGAASHVGLRRAENQDHYVVIRRTRAQEMLLANIPKDQFVLPPDEAFGMAVADGMGATGHGNLASQLAIRTAWELAGRATSWIMRLGDLNTNELAERIEAFTYMMQQAFEDELQTNPGFGDSGTTWTCAYLVSSFAVVANIGDSPCFLWRDRMMGRVSTDHTVQQEFIAAGVPAAVAGKYGHMLTRCFGSHAHSARPDVHHLRLQVGDQLLLCTDGLTNMVRPERIAQCLDESSSAQAACDGLVELALAGGGKDNVTALLARAKAR